MAGRPKAVFWYKVYCHLFALLNLYTAWHGFGLVRDPHGVIMEYHFLRENAVDQPTTDILATMVRTVGWSLLLMGLVFGITAFSLPHAPDNRKTWVAHMIHILFGATSCVLSPLCIPLFFAWLKPEVRDFFGVESRRS